MKKTLYRIALAVGAVFLLSIGSMLGEVAIAGVHKLQLWQEIRGDPRYAVVRQVEEEFPGIYVVDITERELDGGRVLVTVLVTFDRRITSKIDSSPDEETGESDLERYIAGARAAVITATNEHLEFDVLAVALLYIHRTPVLGGEAWQALVIFLEAGEREVMLEWAANGATDYELDHSSEIHHYSFNPFQPQYHYTYLPRLGPPLWETLEALEAE